jgi:hypothetical protein
MKPRARWTGAAWAAFACAWIAVAALVYFQQFIGPVAILARRFLGKH